MTTTTAILEKIAAVYDPCDFSDFGYNEEDDDYAR